MDDVFELAAPEAQAIFLRDVLDGLSRAQRTLPCQYFYDAAGSDLFEQITELPEYYPTRTETAILRAHAEEIASALGQNVLMIEYGAGASTKTRILLDALEDMAGYVPIDVSEEFLLHTAQVLRTDYPALAVHPVVGDFMIRFGLPDDSQGQPVGFFPGSTIGNLSDSEIVQFMHAARDLLGQASQFIIGVDLSKDASILVPAYDDAAGVTAAFNLNLLARINRELGSDFDLSAFAHRAIWNDTASRIEMHLESLRPQTVTLGGRSITFEAGETIHTENSRKFTIDSLTPLFEQTGWTLNKTWLDEKHYFAVLLLSAI
ncbi:MAG: L-histidine N(alpha)-methyltransferase [Hyphomonadaceae bacterium]|nr:L-histidine N(alpha)-methyltransferase [Hyphomonadaceae bacterium]